MAITQLHQDIIQTHILTKLDGQTLAVAAATSSHLRSLSTHRNLWSDICSATWPSTDDPLIRHVIDGFPSGHRSFFSEAFPSPAAHILLPAATSSSPATTTPHLISAVDLFYDDKLLFSKVETTSTLRSDWFKTTPFRIDLLEPKELLPSAVKVSGDGDDRVIKSDLENKMRLSWVVIDPTRNRAVNLSSEKPVLVHRNWLTGDVEVTFAVVVAVAGEGEHVSCNVEVTCGDMNVSGVSLTVHDLDGKCLSGKGSLVILQGLAAAPRRRRQSGGGGEKEKYDEFIQKKRERKEERERKERRLDMVCIAIGVSLFIAFWSFAIC